MIHGIIKTGMAIPTSRTKTAGIVEIDPELCTGCGKCTMVCSDENIALIDGKARPTGKGVFGCIGCGQCMMICPEGAVSVTGRFLSPADLFPLPAKENVASPEALTSLFARRRSIREFRDKPVEKELLGKILDAARMAPMGLPPSDVSVMVIDSKEKVREFAKDFAGYLDRMRWFVSPWFLAMMRPFWGKETDELFRGFMRPLFDSYINNMNKGENVINYDAPALFYFYGSPYCDPADPIIAATYAMIAAESLGLGTIMLGGVHPFIQSGKTARKFREKHGIRCKSREGLFLAVGYPKHEFLRGIRRSFANS
jgi:nitroreductase/NAD-dependent dihydropyrimidine dehydrogenase PreA subunit